MKREHQEMERATRAWGMTADWKAPHAPAGQRERGLDVAGQHLHHLSPRGSVVGRRFEDQHLRSDPPRSNKRASWTLRRPNAFPAVSPQPGGVP